MSKGPSVLSGGPGTVGRVLSGGPGVSNRVPNRVQSLSEQLHRLGALLKRSEIQKAAIPTTMSVAGAFCGSGGMQQLQRLGAFLENSVALEATGAAPWSVAGARCGSETTVAASRCCSSVLRLEAAVRGVSGSSS